MSNTQTFWSRMALGSLWEIALGSVGNTTWVCCRGHRAQDAFTHLSAPCAQIILWCYSPPQWCFYRMSRMYAYPEGLYVWGYLRTQGLCGLYWRFWVLAIISIYALVLGWILAHAMLLAVPSLLFGKKYLHCSRRSQPAGVQVKAQNLLK